MPLLGCLWYRRELCTHSGDSLETPLLCLCVDFSLVGLYVLSVHV